MIEILFSDSACGSLKASQHTGGGRYPGGCVGVIISHHDGSKPTRKEIKDAQRKAEEDARRAWESAVPMEGSAADIFSFGLGLGTGDISGDAVGPARRQALEALFCVYPAQAANTAKEIVETAAERLAQLRLRATAGEAMRVWYSDGPDEMCGLYWLMAQLTEWGIDNPALTAVKLPSFEQCGQEIVQKRGWGEVCPEEWHRYVSLEKPVCAACIKIGADGWRALQQENAPLRAMLNGRLISAPSTLYDDFILREIAAAPNEFRQAEVVGRVLGRYQLGIGDAWVALRMESMIESGLLEVCSAVTADMPIYHRTLKKRG